MYRSVRYRCPGLTPRCRCRTSLFFFLVVSRFTKSRLNVTVLPHLIPTSSLFIKHIFAPSAIQLQSHPTSLLLPTQHKITTRESSKEQGKDPKVTQKGERQTPDPEPSIRRSLPWRFHLTNLPTIESLVTRHSLLSVHHHHTSYHINVRSCIITSSDLDDYDSEGIHQREAIVY